MIKEKFQQNLQNKDVIKLDGRFKYNGGVYYVKENDIVIEFIFSHNQPDGVKRLQFEVVNYNKSLELPSVINNPTTFMVNAHNPDYAMSFVASVDAATRTANLKLIDLPERGYEIMTKEEKEEIIIPY